MQLSEVWYITQKLPYLGEMPMSGRFRYRISNLCCSRSKKHQFVRLLVHEIKKGLHSDRRAALL